MGNPAGEVVISLAQEGPKKNYYFGFVMTLCLDPFVPSEGGLDFVILPGG